MLKTTYSNQCLILADLWLNFREDDEFKDFVRYNDIGLPLAYAIANGIVESTELAERFITETFELLLSGLGMEDTGFELLDDILNEASE